MLLTRILGHSIVVIAGMVMIGSVGATLLPNVYGIRPVTAMEISKGDTMTKALLPVTSSTTTSTDLFSAIKATTSTTSISLVATGTEKIKNSPMITTVNTLRKKIRPVDSPIKVTTPVAKVIDAVVIESIPKLKEVKITSEAAYKAELIRLIEKQTNEFRRSNKITPLTRNVILAKNSTAYSDTMLDGSFLSHIDLQNCDMSCRFLRDHYTALAWGENLAEMNFSGRPTPEYVATYFMQKWENSAEHRANLLSPKYATAGIGVAMNKSKIYLTVQFASN